MGLFTRPKLSEEKVEKLNSLLPSELQRKVVFDVDINEYETGLYKTFQRHIQKNIGNQVDELKKKLINSEESRVDSLAPNIQIFNTEPYDCKPLGMVDIGATHKFSAASTGDRFAGGLIGYAIENAADNVYAKGSMQEQAVNSTKLSLLKKAKTIFPKCNNLFD